MTEARLLSLFNPEHVSSKDVFDLTDQSYSMKTADGHQYVVRRRPMTFIEESSLPPSSTELHTAKSPRSER
jgi:hypothetical protein